MVCGRRSAVGLRPSLILLDEPEFDLHPDAIMMLCLLIRSATNSKGDSWVSSIA